MAESFGNDVTALLVEWRRGDEDALARLIPLVYQELRRLANYFMRGERQEHTLQATALVHEVYLRLVDKKEIDWQDRAHFFAIGAQVMRRMLVDHARAHRAAKRGGNEIKLALNEAIGIARQPDVELTALDDALQSLAKFDARKSKIVELRFFGGLNVEETAEVVGISTATVKREWRMAKAWLFGEITRNAGNRESVTETAPALPSPDS